MTSAARSAAEIHFSIQSEADGMDTVYQDLWRAG